MLGLWKCSIWWGHYGRKCWEPVGGLGCTNSAMAWMVAGPGNDNFDIWKLLAGFEMKSIRLLTGDTAEWGRSWFCQGHWFRIWRAAVSASWYWKFQYPDTDSLSFVCTVFVSWRRWCKSCVSWFTFASVTSAWEMKKMLFVFFVCAIMH